MTRRNRIGRLGTLVALALGLAPLGVAGLAQAALTVSITKNLNMGICEQVTGLQSTVLANSSVQGNQCGSQIAAVVRITGGTANQLVTLTLPASRNLRQTGFPNIAVNTFNFSTSSGLTFPGRTGSFNLDASGTMTVYVGATSAAMPAGAGTTYAGTATVTVL